MSAQYRLLLLTVASLWSSSAQDHGPPGQATTVKRLPLEVLPLHYELQLAPCFQDEGPFKALDVDGEVIIHVEVQNTSTDTITLHAGDSVTANVEGIRISDASDVFNVSSVTTDPDNEMVTIHLGRELSGALTLLIPFLSRLRTDMDGFYLSEYQSDGQTRYLAATQFAPTSARKAFPCFDEPALKANFTVTIYPPAGYGVLSNTKRDTEIGNTTLQTGDPPNRRALPSAAARDAVKFKTTQAMSTYLVGVVVYDSATFSSTRRPTPIFQPISPVGIWSRNDLTHQSEIALDVTEATVDFLGRLFPDYFLYMNDKLDHVAIPDFYFGAMENWGLITYRERALLANERESSSSALRYAVTTMVHELAHQWFGDLVTPDFWNVLWLKEGFATYWAYHVNLGQVTDGWELRDHFLVEQQALALDADALESTHALTSAADTVALYDDISYSKGGSLLRMFSYWLGEDLFYKVLNIYLNNRLYSSAKPEDLFDAVRENNNPRIAEYMETWTNTSGYPVINVTRDGRNATLTQTRYLLMPSESSNYSAPWPTKISYISGTDFLEGVTKFVWLLGEKPVTIHDLKEKEPLFLNFNWRGFYRVNYDVSNWQLIQRQLSSDHTVIPRETRAQLLSDVFSLARSGHVEYDLAFNVSLYLVQEDDYLPWAITFRTFEYLDTVLSSSTHYSAFQSYVKYLLEQLSHDLTFSVRSDDDHMTKSLRAGMAKWLCRMGDTSCRDTALQLARNVLSTSTNGVNPDLHAAFYCVWAEDNVLWDKLWQHYLLSTVASGKVEVLSALGCSQNETKLNMYLEDTLNSTKIKQQDMQTVFTGVYSTPLGFQVATDFIIKNADAFSQGRYAGKIITGLAKRIVTEDELNKLKSLSSLEALQKINATLQSAISTAAAQVEWANTHLNKIVSWLESGNTPAASPHTLKGLVR